MLKLNLVLWQHFEQERSLVKENIVCWNRAAIGPFDVFSPISAFLTTPRLEMMTIEICMVTITLQLCVIINMKTKNHAFNFQTRQWNPCCGLGGPPEASVFCAGRGPGHWGGSAACVSQSVIFVVHTQRIFVVCMDCNQVLFIYIVCVGVSMICKLCYL